MPRSENCLAIGKGMLEVKYLASKIFMTVDYCICQPAKIWGGRHLLALRMKVALLLALWGACWEMEYR